MVGFFDPLNDHAQYLQAADFEEVREEVRILLSRHLHVVFVLKKRQQFLQVTVVEPVEKRDVDPFRQQQQADHGLDGEHEIEAVFPERPHLIFFQRKRLFDVPGDIRCVAGRPVLLHPGAEGQPGQQVGGLHQVHHVFPAGQRIAPVVVVFVAAGAKRVSFDSPLPFYVENFLGFDTGEPVPIYHYDDELAAWLRAADGLVIKIVDVANDLAELDIDGDDVADDVAALTAIGITDAERILFDFYADNWGPRDNQNARLLAVKTLEALRTEKAHRALEAISAYVKNQKISSEEFRIVRGAVRTYAKTRKSSKAER